MKRIPRDPEKFDILSHFDAIGKKRDLLLHDKKSEQIFVESVSKSLSLSKEDPILLHGRRVQSMFGYVAASLGRCSVITMEDCGEIYSVHPDLLPPDYHLLLDNGQELFVEVKNCHKTSPSHKYSLKGAYMDGLVRYANLFHHNLKIAIFWSKWKRWTLLSADRFKKQGDHYTMTFLEAIKMNEMGTIGDTLIGTIPPLKLCFVTDRSKPRTIGGDGNVSFTIGSVELYCGVKQIAEQKEKNIAFYLMLYGDWPMNEPKPIIKNNELLAIEFTAKPTEVTPGQSFEFVGSLSGMLSRRYNELTAPKGQVEKLSPHVEPGELGVVIPKDYKGKQLPLWRIVQQPNYIS